MREINIFSRFQAAGVAQVISYASMIPYANANTNGLRDITQIYNIAIPTLSVPTPAPNEGGGDVESMKGLRTHHEQVCDDITSSLLVGSTYNMSFRTHINLFAYTLPTFSVEQTILTPDDPTSSTQHVPLKHNSCVPIRSAGRRAFVHTAITST